MRFLAPSFVLVLVAAGCGGDPTGTGTTTSTGGATTTSASTGGTGAGGSDTGGTGTTTQTEGLGGTTTTSETGGTGGSGGVTGGTGGVTGGSGGVTGGTGGGTTTSTSTTTGMPGPCTWGEDCGPGYYCFAPGCGAGQCTLKPPPAGLSPTPDPMCGCDGITYWSADVAASKGQSIAVPGACAMPILCAPGLACPVGMRCSRVVPDGASCDPGATGECWGTPLSCSLSGPLARACTTGTCELQCSLIQSENPWYEDASCN